VQAILEEVIRGVGWAMLKLISFGRHKSDNVGAPVVEGALGLVLIAAATWLVYRFWS
jgi:hypothetical protein